MTQTIAYRRVSTTDQKTDRQLTGMSFDREFSDHCTGSNTKRPGLQACMDFLRSGDTLVIHSMDRLSRGLSDLLKLVGDLTSKGITIRFFQENLTFTGEKNPIQDLQLHIIGAVAQFEKNLLHQRQREGFAAAKRAGKHCGRKAKLSEQQKYEIQSRISAGEKKQNIANEFGVSRATIYNVIKK